MSEQPQHPANDDRAAWAAHWQAQGMPWRTEPEVSGERQRVLAERRAVKPDIEKGVYPFKDIKLTRADVEWLLATHESGGMKGPVAWGNPSHQGRSGLDLRGAYLNGVNLGNLPLAKLQGGLSGTNFDMAGKDITKRDITLARAAIHLEQSTLTDTQLQGSALVFALMNGVMMRRAHLEGADIYGAHFEAVIPADLSSCSFDEATAFRKIVLANASGIGPRLRHVHWGGVQLLGSDWEAVTMLADESDARSRNVDGKRPDRVRGIYEYERAITANQLLINALRNQGFRDVADKFAYRTQLLQRHVLTLQFKLKRAFGSWLLDLVSGYGYKPLRSVIAYVAIIALFAGAYLLNAQFAAPHLSWDEALVLSVSSFHGRGFFTTGVSLSDTLARLAAGEAIVGLLIEITFIATFTQRFFAR